MSATKILSEAQNLSGVSERLDSLAEDNPAVAEALLAIAGHLRDSAVLLELLVATRIPTTSELQ